MSGSMGALFQLQPRTRGKSASSTTAVATKKQPVIGRPAVERIEQFRQFELTDEKAVLAAAIKKFGLNDTVTILLKEGYDSDDLRIKLGFTKEEWTPIFVKIKNAWKAAFIKDQLMELVGEFTVPTADKNGFQNGTQNIQERVVDALALHLYTANWSENLKVSIGGGMRPIELPMSLWFQDDRVLIDENSTIEDCQNMDCSDTKATLLRIRERALTEYAKLFPTRRRGDSDGSSLENSILARLG